MDLLGDKEIWRRPVWFWSHSEGSQGPGRPCTVLNHLEAAPVPREGLPADLFSLARSFPSAPAGISRGC